MAIEREYKIDSSAIKDPLKVDIGVGLSKVDEAQREQLSIYFDSKDLDLGRLGIGLRFRTADGEPTRGIWTMKIPRNFSSAGATQREEIEAEGERGDLPSPIRKALQRLALLDSLIPTVSLKTDRTSFRVASDGDRLPIEIDVDVVEFLDGSSYSEVEIEVHQREFDDIAASIAGYFEAAGGVSTKKTKLDRATERSPYSALAGQMRPELLSLEFWMMNGLLLSSIMLSSVVALPGEVESFSFRGVVWEAVCYLNALAKDLSVVDSLLREYAQLSLAISSGRDFIAKGDQLAESIFKQHLVISESRLARSNVSERLVLDPVVIWDDEYTQMLRRSTEKLLERLESIDGPSSLRNSSTGISALFGEFLEGLIGAVPLGIDIGLATSVAECFDLAVSLREFPAAFDSSAGYRPAKIVVSQLLRDLETFERT